MENNVDRIAKKYPENPFEQELMSLADKQDLFRELLGLSVHHRLDNVETVIELALDYAIKADRYYQHIKEEIIKNALTAHAETVEQLKKNGPVKPTPKT